VNEEVCMQKPHNLSFQEAFAQAKLNLNLDLKAKDQHKLKGFAGDLDFSHGSS